MEIYIIVMAALVIMSAYFSATETAFSSLNKTRLKAMEEKGNKKAKLALKLADNYDKLISTILVGNNIVNIALASIGTVFFVKFVTEDQEIAATWSTVVVTVVVLVFGEVTPKSIAKDSPEKFAMFSAPLIRLFIWILAPINLIFSLWKKLIAKIFKLEGSAKMSQEELVLLVEEVEQEGTLDTDEGELIRNAIEFGEQEAEDILIHRVDIVAVDVEEDKNEIANIFFKTKFSRLVVFEETIDNVVGIIHLKDFFTSDGITEKSIKEIMTKPPFIQKSEKLNDLLKILQKSKSHIAVVIDEYGGTLGIVTMEDILEEIVGEIWDEHDEVVETFRSIGNDEYIVECGENFEDFCEFFDIEAESDNISTGGWVMEQLGKIPEKGDNFTYSNLNIRIIETDSHRVSKIKVTVMELSEEEE